MFLVDGLHKCFQIIIQIIIKKPNGKQFLCMFFKKTERKKNEPNKKKIWSMGCINLWLTGPSAPHSKKLLVKDWLKCFQIIIQIIIRKQFLCMLFQKTEIKRMNQIKRKSEKCFG